MGMIGAGDDPLEGTSAMKWKNTNNEGSDA
jgi:hypothetical protein